MNIPSVSIIMNVRNGAAFLREALNSVMAQTFTDWELIFWDDWSTDDSAKIVLEYPDSRIRYFLSPEDTLLGRARHLAIQKAKGQWLAFLDQDDIWLPDKLHQQIDLVKSHSDIGIVYGRTVTFTTNGRQRDYDHRHEFKALPEGDIFTSLFTDSCFIAMSSAVLRRTAVNEIGAIPEQIDISPDYFLYLAIASHYRARAVQTVVCRYRFHDNNMSYSTVQKMHQEALWLIDQWAHHLDHQLVIWRRKVHNTVLAMQEMRYRDTALRGIVRLFTHGSLTYLASRPFARTFRALRRKYVQPYWKSNSTQSQNQ